MDYLCFKVESAEFTLDTPERKAFKAHLEKVANALHDIEWVDSGDIGNGGENEAIRACLASGDILGQLVEDAKEIREQLKRELEQLRSQRSE